MQSMNERLVEEDFPMHLLDSIKPQDVYATNVKKTGNVLTQMFDGQEQGVSNGQGMFPANIYYEGHDQHSRWFLTSLVSSVALTG